MAWANHDGRPGVDVAKEKRPGIHPVTWSPANSQRNHPTPRANYFLIATGVWLRFLALGRAK